MKKSRAFYKSKQNILHTANKLNNYSRFTNIADITQGKQMTQSLALYKRK